MNKENLLTLETLVKRRNSMLDFQVRALMCIDPLDQKDLLDKLKTAQEFAVNTGYMTAHEFYISRIGCYHALGMDKEF